MTATHGPELLDVEQAAEYLGVTPRWMRRAVAERRIEFIRVGRLIRWRKDALDRYLAENTEGALS